MHITRVAFCLIVLLKINYLAAELLLAVIEVADF